MPSDRMPEGGNQSIRESLSGFEIGPADAPLSFARRLALENGWSAEYVERVIAEHKRFLLLASISTRELTPADQVNQAWHLQLSHTRSYWQALSGICSGASCIIFRPEAAVTDRETPGP